MIYKKLILIALTVFLWGSCSRDSSKTVTITWDDFPITHTLKRQKVDLPKLPAHGMIRVLRDSIGLLALINPEKHHAFLVNLNSGELLQKIFPKGRGPNEITDTNLLFNDYNYSDGKFLTVVDYGTRKFFTYRLDSLLKYGDATLPLAQLTCKSAVDESGVCRLGNNDYVCASTYYMTYGNYINKDAPALFRTNQALESVSSFAERSGHETKYKYRMLADRSLFAHPKHQNLVLVDHYADYIRIYDKETLSLKKEIRGPDLEVPKLKLSGNNYVQPKELSLKTSYSGEGCCTDDFIYLVYTQNQPTIITSETKETPFTIFKIDWEGNLVACYHLDAFVLAGVSVSQDGKTLYGHAPSEDFRDFIFVKYDLPD